MVHSKSLTFIGLALALPTASNGFTLTSPSIASSRPRSSLAAAKNPNDQRDAIRNLAALSALSFGLLFPTTNALAAQDTISQFPMNDHAFHSSTVQLSAEIKTMDFSMPSSYDNLSAPVASGIDELVKTETINTGAATRKKKVVSEGLSAKEQAAASRAERVAERKTKEDGQAALDEKAMQERDENIKAARLEKIAKREAAKAEQEAAAVAEKEDAKFKGAKFVDTSMPSY